MTRLLAALLVFSIAPALAQGTTRYAVVPDASQVTFEVKAPFGRAAAAMPVVDGEVLVGAGDQILAASAVVHAASLASENGLIARQLRGPSGFRVEEFPTLAFRATQVTTRSRQLSIDGELTVRDVTQPVRFTGSLSRPGADRLVLVLEGSISRVDFGITAGRPFYSRNADVRVLIEARTAR